MLTVLIAFGAFAAYIIAYNTYGKYLARKIFALDGDRTTPACTINDGVDYVPAQQEVLFGHHFTSIAGAGPIVGPALAVIWGWVPAVLWVVFGSIFMGAVHDFSALVISARNEGRSIADIASDLINPRVRALLFAIIFFALLIVIAVFGLVIAALFSKYPQAIFPVWIEIPIAMALGWAIYRRGVKPLPASLIGVVCLYAAIYVGSFWPETWNFQAFTIGSYEVTPIVSWTVILLIYAYIASTLPVWKLLQPRDYINGHELFIALGLLSLGVLFARPEIVAPTIRLDPEGAPPIWPMLFITIACGAVSGFHSLVSSGTTSKQLSDERHCLSIGYGGMLLESMLAIFVIIAATAGLGMAVGDSAGGQAAWMARYETWGGATGLGAKVSAFVDGSANMLTSIGIPLTLGVTLMGVFVASFAATTLDTSVRLQRYVIAEAATSLGLKKLASKHVATFLAVVTALAMALPNGGKGGLILWPLFAAVNQLLASLALLIATVYLRRHGKPVFITLLPMLFMLVLTAWAMKYNLQTFFTNWETLKHLFIIGSIIVALEIWVVIEAAIVFVSIKPKSQAVTNP